MIELVLAMAVASFMMIILTSGILQLLHIYEAGVSIRATQQQVRLVTEEITRVSRNSEGYAIYSADHHNPPSADTPADHRRLYNDRICIFTSVGDVAGGKKRLYGSVYTVEANPQHTGYTSIFRYTLQAVDVTPTYNNYCPSSGTNRTQVTSADVTIMQFAGNRDVTSGASAYNPYETADQRQLTIDLSLSGVTQDNDKELVLSPQSAKKDVHCKDSVTGQYCSVTQVEFTTAARSEGTF